jgi:hypothetical protein
VFEKTASESVPVAVMVPVLISVSLLPCRWAVGLFAPDVDKAPLLLIVPLPPMIEAARALLPEVATEPVLTRVLFNCPTFVCPQAADIP